MTQGDTHLDGLRMPSRDSSNLLTAGQHQLGNHTFEQSGVAQNNFGGKVVSLQRPQTLAQA